MRTDLHLGSGAFRRLHHISTGLIPKLHCSARTEASGVHQTPQRVITQCFFLRMASSGSTGYLA